MIHYKHRQERELNIRKMYSMDAVRRTNAIMKKKEKLATKKSFNHMNK